MHSYQVQYHPRAEHLRIKITPAAEVIVVAPRHCPSFFIDLFVRQHQAWITETLEKVNGERAKRQARGASAPTGQQVGSELVHGRKVSVSIFGQTYVTQLDALRLHPVGCHIKDDLLIITPVQHTAASIQKALDTFLKSTATKYILPRLEQLAQKMSITFGTVTLREQRSRWGSCSASGNLNFNWRLVHAPPAVIDYVIVHELAHRTHMNHGAGFWALVAKYDPEYQKHRGWLKRQGMGLD